MTEIIKDIKGFEGRYTISNLGIVRSIIGGKNIILKPSITKFGYARINLRKENERKVYSYFVHRLVAGNFLANPNKLPEVNHIDSNRLNNNVNNLEWISREDNVRHSFLFGAKSNRGIKNPNAKLIGEDVIAIRALHRTNRFSNTEISKLFFVSPSTIDNIVNNKNWCNNETNKDNQQPRFINE